MALIGVVGKVAAPPGADRTAGGSDVLHKSMEVWHYPLYRFSGRGGGREAAGGEGMPGHRTSARGTEFRRHLRQVQTPAEIAMWNLLRGRRLREFKFRRQPHIGGWVVDFACMSHRAVVEVDGSVHKESEKQRSDKVRAAWLRDNGSIVLRFFNDEVALRPGDVLASIVAALGDATPGEVPGVAGSPGAAPSPPPLRGTPFPAEAVEGEGHDFILLLPV